ncbi:MAG: amidohydrolase family protein [Hyphomicrobiaceae bacterium]
MIIDCHAHLIPASLLEQVKKDAAKFPSVKLNPVGESVGFQFASSKPTRPAAKGLYDLAARLAWMDKNGIDRQVCGGWLDMMGNELPIEEGERWNRIANEHMMSVAKSESRIIPLAALPMQDGARAAQVLKDAHAAGYKGAMIGTQPKGVGGVLDDPSLDVFWKTADDLGTVIFFHPVFESGDNRVHDYGMANAIGRITDTMIALGRLIYAGHVIKYKNIKFIAGIGGAALPYIAGRLRRNYAVEQGKVADPDASLAALWYDALVQDVGTLKFLASKVGSDRIMLGSDMPFPIGDLDQPKKLIADAGFSADEAASINGGLAAKLFA